MPLALTGYEIGLLSVAVVFMIFALVAALVVPRRRPEFPTKYLGWFIAACIVLFVSQMTAVLLLAELGEVEEVAHESEPAEPTETTPTEPTSTETAPTTETTPTTDATNTTEAQGDPVAGKELFLGAPACGSCHTLADAGTSGTIGPNLDAASPSYDKVVERVTNGQGVMPSFKDTLSEQQIQDVAAYVSSAVEG